jgi:hypothetical protein
MKGDGGHENEIGRQARRQEERQRGRIYERQMNAMEKWTKGK